MGGVGLYSTLELLILVGMGIESGDDKTKDTRDGGWFVVHCEREEVEFGESWGGGVVETRGS